MLANERFQRILLLVEQKKNVSVQELMSVCDASESTIRRDLGVLDKNGQLIKVHGGAVAIDHQYFTTDADVFVRQGQNQEEKIQIAKYAASIITPDDFVFLDAGTTTGEMISMITSKQAVFVTNSFSHAKMLAAEGIKTYILGGEIKSSTEAVVGEEAIRSLLQYNFTKGFFGVNGISKRNGFTTPEVSEANVKRIAMDHCKEKFVLADNTKFSQISSVTFADFESATIITDMVMNREFKECSNVVEVK